MQKCLNEIKVEDPIHTEKRRLYFVSRFGVNAHIVTSKLFLDLNESFMTTEDVVNIELDDVEPDNIIFYRFDQLELKS